MKIGFVHITILLLLIGALGAWTWDLADRGDWIGLIAPLAAGVIALRLWDLWKTVH